MTTDKERSIPAAPLEPKPPALRGHTATSPVPAVVALSVHNLSVFFGAAHVLNGVSLDIEARAVTAIIGPSGCGKTTFLRSINRMHELVATDRIQGERRLLG